MLILPIQKKWFDMIKSGEKKEEYREIKPYWTTRFLNWLYPVSYQLGLPTEHYINYLRNNKSHTKTFTFRNGYRKDSPQIKCKCVLGIGQGKEEWGAEKRKRILCFRNIRSFGGVKIMYKEYLQEKKLRF